MIRSNSTHDYDLPFVHLDDESFKTALFELQYGTIRLQQDRLETLAFNPIHITEQSVTNTFYLDPDSQYSFTFDSKYYISDQFNEINSKRSFSIVTLKCS